MKKATILVEPALVGREEELEELEHCLDSAIEGRGLTVLISGEAGCGKTRLVTEFISAAKKKRQVISVTGGCLSNAAVSYSPFIEAFSSFLSEKGGKGSGFEELEIDAWLSGAKQAEKSERYKNLAPQAWRDLTFAAVTKALSMMSAEQPVVFCIEDLHWADSASLALLHFAARALRSAKVLFLATYRSEELTTDEEGHGHPLAEELRLMRRERLLTEINLSNLDQANVTEVAENMMGGTLDAELSARLAMESRGNVLFVVESLRMLFERGSLYEEDGLWRLSADTLGIPERFKDVILRRLSVLKFNQRRVLDAASVVGERFDFELLSAVLGQDSLEVLEALNAIAKSTSLVRAEGDFFRFDHAKSREVIYEELSLPLKKGYHRRVAEKLEGAGKDGRLPLGEIVYHCAEAGNTEKAVTYALEAGQEALMGFSNAEAIKHFAFVLQNVPDVLENAEIRSTALEGVGDAYYANGLFAKALDVFERFASFATGVAKLRAYRKAMDAIFFGTREWGRFLELVKKAEPFAASDRLESARIRFLKGGAVSGSGNPEAGLKDIEEALRVFEEEYSLSDAARALTAVGASVTLLARQPQRILSASLRSIAMHEELGDLRWLIDAKYYGGVSLFSCLLRREAEEQLKKAVEIGEKIGDYNRLTRAYIFLSIISAGRGHIEESLGNALKAVENSEKTDSRIGREGIFAGLVKLYSKLGDLEHAQTYFSKISGLLSGTESIDPTSMTVIGSVLISGVGAQLTRAVFLAANSRWEEANQIFDEALRTAEADPHVQSILSAKADYAWALNLQGRTEEANILLQESQKILEEVESRFNRVNVQASLMVPRIVVAGEEFEMRLDLVNVSNRQGLLLKVDDLYDPEFKVTFFSQGCYLHDGSMELEKKAIEAFKVETVKLKAVAPRAGIFCLNPHVTFLDELGEARVCAPSSVAITVKPAKPSFEVLPGRITTGFPDLDALLLGGIPEKYAVVLASPSTDERDLLVQRFLEAGADKGETTFHIATEAARSSALAEKFQSTFFLLLCNPQADTLVEQSLPNVSKLKGVENLTEIDIALTKAFRLLDSSAKGSKRMCIDIVSDVLLTHHAVNTRRWLSALLPTLKSKGFTTLATINPRMHPQEELEAVISIFDGEIRVSEKETTEGTMQALKVRKLGKQRYLESELVLSREKLER